MKPGRQPHTVLIVEDESLIALALKAELERAGFRIVGIEATEAGALACAKQTTPDVALIDYRLEQGSGDIVASALRACGTAVIMASGNCETLHALESVHGLWCMEKPFSVASAPAAIRFVLDSAERTPPHGLRRI